MISQSTMPSFDVVFISWLAISGKPGILEVRSRTLETSTVWLQDSTPVPVTCKTRTQVCYFAVLLRRGKGVAHLVHQKPAHDVGIPLHPERSVFSITPTVSFLLLSGWVSLAGDTHPPRIST